MTHLTLTGYYAGRTLCGALKTSDHQYLHYAYAPLEKLQRNEIPGYGPLCSECMAEVEAVHGGEDERLS